jgi:hypothetical protein
MTLLITKLFAKEKYLSQRQTPVLKDCLGKPILCLEGIQREQIEQ